ncbi:MAG: MotA/TolQ/ExbB proton channel family protein [Chitinivibrionales bacterium]|nr:MotA/TolQ/ExbB proton channel family protein [Chitinivibrionales bacterium]
MRRKDCLSGFFVVLLMASPFAADKNIEKVTKAKEQERALLQTYLEQARDSLQLEVTRRYGLRQQLIEQRENDKTEFENLKEQQERTGTQLSQVKEEVLAKEQQLGEEQKNTAMKQDEIKQMKSSMDELFQKEASEVAETFPLDRAYRQADFEQLRRQFAATRDLAGGWSGFTDYKIKYIKRGGAMTVEHQRVLPDEGGHIDLTFSRFGNVFGYGIDSSSVAYLLRQTGRLGKDKYTVEKINSPELASFVLQALPTWLSQKKPSGVVLFDILQNDQSRQLVAGVKKSFWRNTYDQMKEGGAIMIPILLLPIWILYLLGRKITQIYSRKIRFKRHYGKVMSYIDGKNYDTALSYVKKRKGAMARILETCLEYRSRDRHGCERVVREIIYHELPIVSSSINTVAVIAGAAPLLGLLGTISGMITLFAAVTHYGTGDPKFLAGGISEALITAKTGLAIAIPALFLHDYLRSSKENLFAQIEEYATHTMNRLWPEG